MSRLSLIKERLVLVGHGAQLEARSTTAGLFMNVKGSTFGEANGTPLTWAVAEDSIPATKALLRLGADPFDTAARGLPVQNSWGNLMHETPVDFAAKRHQHYLLRHLLAPPALSGTQSSTEHERKLRDNLNAHFRQIGTHGDTASWPPLHLAVSYLADGLLMRLLLHANNHESAFKKTFEILVRAGSDPFDEHGAGTTALEAAVWKGQLFAIRFLLEREDCLLRPDALQWLRLVRIAMRCNDRIVFALLCELESCQEDAVNCDQWSSYLRTAAEVTDDCHFLDRFQNRFVGDSLSAFSAALDAGNLATAQWIFRQSRERHDLRLTSDMSEFASLLGELISKCSDWPSAVLALDCFLELEDLPDDIYYNVQVDEGSELTALHVACSYQKGVNATPWAGAVRAVLNKWDEQDQVNYQLLEGRHKGQTPLHYAVHCVNSAVVDYLLQEELDLLDLTLVDAAGRTAVDVAFESFARRPSRTRAPTETYEQDEKKDTMHIMKAFGIIARLLLHAAPANKYVAILVRLEAAVFVIDATRGPQPLVIEGFFTARNPRSQ